MQVPGWDTPWGPCEAWRTVLAPAIRGGRLPAHGVREPPVLGDKPQPSLKAGDAWSWHIPERAAAPLSGGSTGGSRGRLWCHSVPPWLTF